MNKNNQLKLNNNNQTNTNNSELNTNNTGVNNIRIGKFVNLKFRGTPARLKQNNSNSLYANVLKKIGQ